MDTSKETVLRELVSMCYDIVVAEALKTDHPGKVYIDFFREIAAIERELLREQYGIEATEVNHPITAIRKYCILNVKSYEYRFIDEIKLEEIKDDKIHLRQWKCPYVHNCMKYKRPMCVRGIAQGLAIDHYSQGDFKDIKVDFDMGGNCGITLALDYDGDLSKPPKEEKRLEDDIYRVLTLEDHRNLSIHMWVQGVERAAIAVFGPKGAKDFLRKFHNQLVEKWIEKFFKIDYYIGLPISLWTEGQFIFQ